MLNFENLRMDSTQQQQHVEVNVLLSLPCHGFILLAVVIYERRHTLWS